MPHLLEPASSGRAKCRGCGGKIAAGEWRFGERLPNPFADDAGEMTHWFHPWCAAYRRPEAFLELMASPEAPALEGREAMVREAQAGVTHHRLPRVNTAEPAPTGRATCRACRQLIEKGAWRISLVYYEDGRFAPSGFVHATCAAAYFETPEILARVKHFSPSVGEADLAEVTALLSRPAG